MLCAALARASAAARALVRSEDEVGLLAGGFNEMAGTIQAQEVRAEQLYAELEARDAVRRQLLGRLTTPTRRSVATSPASCTTNWANC